MAGPTPLVRKGRFGVLAIITDSNFAFGMARMYQILAESLPVQIGVVRTLGGCDDVSGVVADRGA